MSVPNLKLVLSEADEERAFELYTRTGRLAERQGQDARDFIARIRAGGYLRFPWPDVDELVGPLLPGWLVAFGGRGKAGKSTFLRDCFSSWTEMGKKCVYVGTETAAAVLRLTWAAARLNLPVETAIDPKCPESTMQQLLADVHIQTTGPLAHRAVFGDTQDATVEELHRWVKFAARVGADVLIFDHFGRMDLGGSDHAPQRSGRAVRAIKQMTKSEDLLVVMGAQLTQGEGGSWLGEHEIPGNKSWAGTAEIQREVDIGLQAWRPFVKGVTPQQKREAKDDAAKVQDLVQQNVMGLRVAAHRWKGSSMNKCTRLYVENDQLHSWGYR